MTKHFKRILSLLLPSLLLCLNACATSGDVATPASTSPVTATPATSTERSAQLGGFSCADFTIYNGHNGNVATCDSQQLTLSKNSETYPEVDLTAAKELTNYAVEAWISWPSSDSLSDQSDQNPQVGFVIDTPPNNSAGGTVFVIDKSGAWRPIVATSMVKRSIFQNVNDNPGGNVGIQGDTTKLLITRSGQQVQFFIEQKKVFDESIAYHEGSVGWMALSGGPMKVNHITLSKTA